MYQRIGGFMKAIKSSFIYYVCVMVMILVVFLLSGNAVFADGIESSIEKSVKIIEEEEKASAINSENEYSIFNECAGSEIIRTKLYKLNNANLINKNGKLKVNCVSGYYTGHESSKNEGYIVIDYNYGTYLAEKSHAKAVDGAVVLSTSVISQIDGKYEGYSACGPTSAAILLNNEKGLNLHKDDLIKYSIKHNLNNQGSLVSMTGGMTSANVIKLISAYGYNAINIYDNSVKPSGLLKHQIDSEKRAVVLVKYRGGIQRSEGVAHFVVICGYKYINEKLCFYYADSYYSSGEGRSLMKISANTLDASMSGTFSEPNTILVLE